MSHWYVIQSKPRDERRAFDNLMRQSFFCYLPMLAVEKLRRGSRRDVLEPLFPGYLFIQLNELSDNWHPIRSTRGVIQLLCFRENPTHVPDETIECIRQRLSTAQSRITYLQHGERVVITEGAFSGVEAIFVANDGQERVVLLMNILNHEQLLRFPVAAVRRADLNSAGTAT